MTPSEVPNLLITPKKVARTIHTLDASKVTGADGIPVIVLKMYSPELSPALAKLFNLCLACSVFPSSWKVASVALSSRVPVRVQILLITVLSVSFP